MFIVNLKVNHNKQACTKFVQLSFLNSGSNTLKQLCTRETNLNYYVNYTFVPVYFYTLSS